MSKIKRVKHRRPWGLTGARIIMAYYRDRDASSYELGEKLKMHPAAIRTTLRRYGLHTNGRNGRPCHF